MARLYVLRPPVTVLLLLRHDHDLEQQAKNAHVLQRNPGHHGGVL